MIVKLPLANSAITIVLFAVLLTGCSSAGLALVNTRAKLMTPAKVIKDIQYGDKAWQYLDVYQPKHSNNTANPSLVFFYGGGWDSGKKEDYLFAAAKFVDLGYTVIVPDYVKFPQGKFPTFIEDGAKALAWLKKNAAKYNADPNNLFVVGHSAGAHLGALLLADANYLASVNLSPQQIRAFAGLAGPYNFTPRVPRYVRIFEPASNYPKMRVSNFIDGDEPPMILLHGSKDKLVSVDNKDSTISAINNTGGISKGINYPGVSHVRLLLGITWPLIGNADPSSDIDDFFRHYLVE